MRQPVLARRKNHRRRHLPCHVHRVMRRPRNDLPRRIPQPPRCRPHQRNAFRVKRLCRNPEQPIQLQPHPAIPCHKPGLPRKLRIQPVQLRLVRMPELHRKPNLARYHVAAVGKYLQLPDRSRAHPRRAPASSGPPGRSPGPRTPAHPSASKAVSSRHGSPARCATASYQTCACAPVTMPISLPFPLQDRPLLDMQLEIRIRRKRRRRLRPPIADPVQRRAAP